MYGRYATRIPWRFQRCHWPAEVFRLVNEHPSNNHKLWSAFAAYLFAISYPLFYATNSISLWLIVTSIASAVVVGISFGATGRDTPPATLARGLVHTLCLVTIPALTITGLLRHGVIDPVVPDSSSIDAFIGLHTTSHNIFTGPAVLGPATALISLLIANSQWRTLVSSFMKVSARPRDADAEYVRLSVINSDLIASTLGVSSLTLLLIAFLKIQSTGDLTVLTLVCLITTALSSFAAIISYFLMSISSSEALKALAGKPSKPVE